MSAIAKTEAIERKFLPITSLVGNDLNPNSMSDAEFNMLHDNFEKTGMTDPILVRPLPDGTYRIIGGHHRLEVAKLYDFKEIPCTIITDPDFDEDQEKFQVVRMNVIHGKMSPEKFMKLYNSMNVKYADDIMADAFGFAEEEDFKKMVKQVSAGLPKELQKEFQKAAAEIKTIDGLSKLLNTLFNKHGDTLPYGYMVVDFGGKDNVWMRMSNTTRKALLELGQQCITNQRTIDDILGGLIQEAAKGNMDDIVLQLIAGSPEVFIPQDSTVLPTADALAA